MLLLLYSSAQLRLFRPKHKVCLVFDLFLTEKRQDQYQASLHYYLGKAAEFVYAADDCFGSCSVKLVELAFHLQAYHILVQIASIHFALYLLSSISKQ